MKRNIGTIDRVIRLVVGLIIVVVGLQLENWWGAVGLAPIITAVIGWTPAYVPFGISTCARNPHEGPDGRSD